MREEITDAMSIMLQRAADRDTRLVYPFPAFKERDEKYVEKHLNMLIRRKLIKRIEITGIEPFHRMVRGIGRINYIITQRGFDAVNLEGNPK